jgi:hypothetical protein
MRIGALTIKGFVTHGYRDVRVFPIVWIFDILVYEFECVITILEMLSDAYMYVLRITVVADYPARTDTTSLGVSITRATSSSRLAIKNHMKKTEILSRNIARFNYM